jgi:sugar O-acyltransferase (sialic acid O-acetyltransferase NeuD family)
MLVIGAKDFAKELLVVFDQCNLLDDLVFYDNISNDLPETLYGFRIITNDEDAVEYLKQSGGEFVIGMGNPHNRRFVYDKFVKLGGKPANIISPYAKIGRFGVEFEPGTIIMTDAIMTANIKMGKGCLINKTSVIGNGAVIGDFVEISPAVQILGSCTIGSNTHICASVTVIPKTTIGSNVVVAAGTVVTKDVPDNCMIAGVPAVIKKYFEPKN